MDSSSKALSNGITYPLSLPQRAIYLDALVHGPTTKFNMGGAFLIHGPLDVELFRKSLECALGVHDVQRTRLHLDGETAMQEFLPLDACPCPFKVFDFSDHPEPFQSAMEWVLADFAHPMGLDQFPLHSDILFRLCEDEYFWYPTFHHIANDAFGHSLIAATIATAYNELLRTGRLPEFEQHSYLTFLEDDSVYSNSEQFHKDENFWREKFQTMPEPLPFSKRKGILTGDVLHTERFTLGVNPYVYDSMVKRCHEAGVTTFQFLLACLFAYLNRVTGNDDIVIGTPILNRSNRAFRSTAGMFMSMMPLRISLDKNESLFALAAKIKSETRACYRHQRFPLGEILHHCRSLDGFCYGIFDVTFVYRNLEYDVVFGDSPMRAITLDTRAREETLSIEVDEYNEGEEVNFFFNYHPQLISKVEAEQMAWAFETLFKDVALEGDRLIREIPLLPESGPFAIALQQPTLKQTVVDMFKRSAEKDQNAIAIVCGVDRMTYSELDHVSNRIASFLAGVCATVPEQPIAVLCDRNTEWISAMLGIMKAGCAYLPLDPDIPRERLEFILHDSECTIILAGERYCMDTFKGGRSIPIAEASAYSGFLTAPAMVLSKHLAYIIYTSGTTGQPKGVLIEHGSFANTVNELIRGWEITAHDRVLGFASPMFDASIVDNFLALASGATLVIASKDVILDSNHFLDLLQNEKVTVATLPSAYLSALGQVTLTPLRLLVTAGDAANPSDVAYYVKRLTYVNAYGPTETSVCVSYLKLSAGTEFSVDRVSIGKPIENTYIQILDEELHSLPIGAIGEIYIGGAGLARGYLNRPELTALRFFENPLHKGERLYRTGDLGCLLSDGGIEFIGRCDTQVKIRGYRVELGEVETTLKMHPDVKTAIVTTSANANKLVAYVVPRTVLDSRVLRRFLASKLPAYMMPSAFVFLQALPLTSTGKINREALPEPEFVTVTQTVTAPRDALEEILAGLWTNLLHQTTIGVHDNFFELGGHSLIAIQLTSRLRDVLGVTVPVLWIFEAPTIAELATRIRAFKKSGESAINIPANRILPDTNRITPDHLPLIILSPSEIENIVQTVDGGVSNIQDIYPLAPLQEGILFHHLLQETGDAYISSALFAFASFARSKAFITAIQAIIDRHDIMRTAIVWEQLREPVQVVWRKAALPVEIRSFDPTDGPIVKNLVDSFNPRKIRLDLNHAPLMRIILTEDRNRWLMLLLLHHVISDHTTLSGMLEEISVHLKGETQQLPLPVPFRNFVIQAREGITPEAHEAFFRDMLGDIETPTAPFGLLDVHGDASETVQTRRILPLTLSLRIRKQAQLLGATSAALCHLAWALVLGRCCNQADVVFGTVIMGRMQGGEGVERALGIFINTLPIRITCDARPITLALRETQKRLLALMIHEQASLTLAQRCSGVPAPTPLFSSLFNYRHSSTQNYSIQQLEGVEILQTEELTNYSFDMSVDDLGDVFSLSVQVDASIEPDRICDYMQRALEVLVTTLEESPETPFCELDILPLAEKQQMLTDWNNTTTPLPETCIHKMFEEQAAKTPDAQAIVFENESFTYSELNIRANQLAHTLIALGVKADEPVAVSLERSPGMIIALLAVLKAGGAYVPFDPDYPTSRLAFMLEDSGAKILITHKTLYEQMPHTAEHTIYFDAEAACIARQPATNPNHSVAPENLAYIIYTSGSTGKPKGVAVEHRSIAYHCHSIQSCYELIPEDRVYQFSSFSFDASLEQILPTLCAGAVLILPSPGLPSPESLDASLRLHGVTVLDLPPAFSRLWAAYFGKRLSPLLRLIILGGEALSQEDLIARSGWPKPWPRLLNAYGPTEATITTTVYDIPEILPGTSIPIGRPLPQRTTYVLDRNNMLSPIGSPGELHIGGLGLARGYLNNPELTTQKFIPDPFNDAPGARLYKTGDLVCYRHDGNLGFIGRIDHQVKVRGFRIELGEIEAALASHPNIREAEVISHTDESGENRLIAYVVAEEPYPISSDLRMYLKKLLPDHMLPAAFVFLAALPRAQNGNVDRSALPEPGAHCNGQHYKVPRDAIEQELVQIWENVLSVHPIGIEDNFFELGGHSLLAIRLVSEIDKRFGKVLPLIRLFEFPTIEGIASLLRKDGEMPEASSLVRIRPQGSRPPIFFLPGAGGIVSYLYPLVQHLDPEIPFYAFQAQGLNGNSALHESLEAMAEHYVNLLQEVQPYGPYFLAGHSFGGLVAFEMAQILLALGQDILLLAIVDTVAPGEFRTVNADKIADDISLLLDSGQLLSLLIHQEIPLTREILAGLNDIEPLAYIALRLAEVHVLPEDDAINQFRNIFTQYKINITMQDKYVPKLSQPLPITLFRASTLIEGQTEMPTIGEDWGWGRYSSHPVPVYYMPGNHLTMMAVPNVEKLARGLMDNM